MHSALYTGHVAHNRPGKHRLRYSVFMLALDLDEIDYLGRRPALLTHNGPALFFSTIAITAHALMRR